MVSDLIKKEMWPKKELENPKSRLIIKPSRHGLQDYKEREDYIKKLKAKKVTIKPRQMGYGCSADCSLSCRNKITENERYSAFNSYWKLGDQSLKWQCLHNWVKTEKVKQSNAEDEDEDEERPNKKKISRIYRLPDEKGNFVRVCQTMFLETLRM